MLLSILLFTFFSSNGQMKTAKQILHNEVSSGKTPAASYIFFNADSAIYSYSEGMADVGGNNALTSANTFHAFSITKTLTALAILQLQDEGLLDLDDPIAEYLPHTPYGEHITIRHLLTHTAGLPNPLPMRWIHLAGDHQKFDAHAWATTVLQKHYKPRSVPGARFVYSNLGYLLIGQVIEQASGQQYEEYVTEHILSRVASASELSFNIDTLHHAKGYQKKNSLVNVLLSFMIDKKKVMMKSEGDWKPFRFNYVNGAAYGGLIANAEGMMKYGQAILRGDLLSAKSKRQYFAENRTTGSTATAMALSWYMGNLEGIPYYHHAGGGGGYYAEFRLYPHIGCGSIVLFNRSGMSDERFLDKVDAELINKMPGSSTIN